MQLRASDIMSEEPITLHPGMTCEEAADILIDNHISGAPVVDDTDELVGVITLFDLIGMSGIPINHPISTYWEELQMGDRDFYQTKPASYTETFVSDCMSRNVKTALPDVAVQELASRMYENGIHRLIITDPGGKRPVGIVTTFDLLKIFATYNNALQPC